MGNLFGTDGVRGVANRELTGQTAFLLGQAGASILVPQGSPRPTVLVGTDTRISADMLKAALMAGICSTGAIALDLGILPTPAVAYLTRAMEAHAGVMITASHNPVEDNGIKFFDAQGFKLDVATEDHIEAVLGRIDPQTLPVGEGVGRIRTLPNAAQLYQDFLMSTALATFDGMHIIIDGANGAASLVAPALFTAMGAKVTAISCEPDGRKINQNCGSTHPERLQEYVRQLCADVGLAFDGDADRLIAVDDQGQLFDGDHVLAVAAMYMKEQGLLEQNAVVGTAMSNLGLKVALAQQGIELLTTGVGDRYVLECMREKSLPLGGEQSGHIIFLDHNSTGDGLLTAMQLLCIMQNSGKKLSELRTAMESYPQTLINIPVSNAGKEKLLQDEVIAQAVRDREALYGDSGRILIRPSGTEPLVRVMVEGKDAEQIDRDANALADLIVERLQ